MRGRARSNPAGQNPKLTPTMGTKSCKMLRLNVAPCDGVITSVGNGVM
jgi:hypothetical protein